jgi:hypothetical protein
VINKENLDKLLLSRLKQYTTSAQFMNDMHRFGLSRHSSMVLGLLLLGRDYDRTMRVLLLTRGSFEGCINEIHSFLKSFKKKQKLFGLRSSK